MATLQIAEPPSQSAWDIMRHFAEVACKSVGAYLTGNFVFTFANTTKRTVKLHISEDTTGAQAAGVIGCDYLLTVPPGATAVEVPAGTARIRVSAGFYHSENGFYEVFWTQRPFHWEAGCLITVAPRHSVDANRFHLDVWPGAPVAQLPSKSTPKLRDGGEAKALTDATKSLRMLALPAPRPLAGGQKALPDCKMVSPEESLVLPGLQIFARNSQGWVPQTVNKELMDGTLEVTNGGSSGPRCVTLNPEEEPALIRMPPLALLDGTLSDAEASRYIYSMRSTLSQSEQTGSGESSGAGAGESGTLSSQSSS